MENAHHAVALPKNWKVQSFKLEEVMPKSVQRFQSSLNAHHAAIEQVGSGIELDAEWYGYGGW